RPFREHSSRRENPGTSQGFLGRPPTSHHRDSWTRHAGGSGDQGRIHEYGRQLLRPLLARGHRLRPGYRGRPTDSRRRETPARSHQPVRVLRLAGELFPNPHSERRGLKGADSKLEPRSRERHGAEMARPAVPESASLPPEPSARESRWPIVIAWIRART